jgi:hypothetical protein
MGHVVLLGTLEMHAKSKSENLKERDYFDM